MWVKNEEFRPLVISLCLVRDCMKHNTKTIHLQNLKPGDYYPHIMITSGLPRLFFFALAFFGVGASSSDESRQITSSAIRFFVAADFFAAAAAFALEGGFFPVENR